MSSIQRRLLTFFINSMIASYNLSSISAPTSLSVASPSRIPSRHTKEVLPTTFIKKAPRVRMVRFELGHERAIVTHEFVFEKDALQLDTTSSTNNETAALCLSFTAQKRPLAVQAFVQQTKKDETEPVPISMHYVSSCPSTHAVLIGRASFAGHEVRLPFSSQPFALKIQSVVSVDPRKPIQLLARLSVPHGPALAFEHLEIQPLHNAKIFSAHAFFCGRGANNQPLAVIHPEPRSFPIYANPNVFHRASHDVCLFAMVGP